MSLWGHHVLAEDVPAEDILDRDVLGKVDMKSTQGHKVLARMSLCGHQVPNKDVPVEDIMSARGHDVLGRMSLCGHHVPDGTSLDGDVLGKDIKSLCGHHALDGDVLGRDVLGKDVLGGDIRSTQGRPRRGHLCLFLLLPLRIYREGGCRFFLVPPSDAQKNCPPL